MQIEGKQPIKGIEGTHYHQRKSREYIQLSMCLHDTQTGYVYEVWQRFEEYRVVIKSPTRMIANDISREELEASLMSPLPIPFHSRQAALDYIEESIQRKRNEGY